MQTIYLRRRLRFNLGSNLNVNEDACESVSNKCVLSIEGCMVLFERCMEITSKRTENIQEKLKRIHNSMY